VQRSLSVLLPVHNAQHTLCHAVHEIIDELVDRGDEFELLVIDDGSTDATSEVAHELSRDYPQVRFIRHGKPQGREAAIRAGLSASRGETVVLRDAEQGGFRVLHQHQQAASHRPARPNFLRRVKEFTTGE
jgi:dolichol-phosphate mannosyltransferase